MGFLDVPAPLFGALDALIVSLPAWVRLTIWALATAVVAIALYRLAARVMRRASVGRARVHIVSGLITALPVAAIIAYIDNTYAYQLPQPGSYVHGHSMPEMPLADLTTLAGDPERAFLVNYPYEGERSEVVAANGEVLLSLPMKAAVPVIHKRYWWNWLVGNPNGYLPDDYEIDSLHIMLPKQKYLPIGPDWMRGWAFSYFSLVALAGMTIRFGWRDA